MIIIKKPPKFTLIYALLLILLSSLVISTTAWESYSKFNTNIGRQDSTFFGTFAQDNSHAFTKLTTGLRFQPLSIDMDSDGDLEIIGHSGNFIKLYEINSDGVLTLLDEHNIGGYQVSAGSTSGDYYVLPSNVSGGNRTYLVGYNGSSFNITYNTPPESAIQSGVACKDDICYFARSGGNITKFNVVTNVSTTESVDADDIFNLAHLNQIGISIFDIDNDNVDELILPCDCDTDNLEGVCVINSDTLQYDIGFDDDGCVEDIEGAAGFAGKYLTGLLAYNIDGSGLPEICVSYYREGTGAVIEDSEDSLLKCMNSDGSQYDAVLVGEDIQTGGQTMAYNPVLCDVDNQGYPEICVYAVISTGSTGYYKGNLQCYEASAPLILDYRTGFFEDGASLASPTYVWWDNSKASGTPFDVIYSFSCADMNNDGYEDIVFPNAIFFSDGFNNFTKMNMSSDTGDDSRMRQSMIADVNTDQFLEFVAQDLNFMGVALSNENNSPPILNTRDFGQNFASPVCLDTTVTFIARECGAEPCHYTNDGAGDQERLSSHCGTNSTITNGTWSLAAPSISCFYDTAGTYVFDIYLQDNANPANIDVSRSKTLIIINGTAGVSCNLPVSGEIAVGINTSSIAESDEITSEDELKDAIEILTAQSQFMKILLAIIFTIMVMFGLAKYTGLRNPISYAIGIFALWILFAMLGLLPWSIVLVYALVAISLAAITFIVGGGKE